jgi:hypothetical protein
LKAVIAEITTTRAFQVFVALFYAYLGSTHKSDNSISGDSGELLQLDLAA